MCAKLHWLNLQGRPRDRQRTAGRGAGGEGLIYLGLQIVVTHLSPYQNVGQQLWQAANLI